MTPRWRCSRLAVIPILGGMRGKRYGLLAVLFLGAGAAEPFVGYNARLGVSEIEGVILLAVGVVCLIVFFQKAEASLIENRAARGADDRPDQ